MSNPSDENQIFPNEIRNYCFKVENKTEGLGNYQWDILDKAFKLFGLDLGPIRMRYDIELDFILSVAINEKNLVACLFPISLNEKTSVKLLKAELKYIKLFDPANIPREYVAITVFLRMILML